MSFCAKCSELEAQIELLTKKHYDEMQCMKIKLQDARDQYNRVKSENEALSLDLAFYNKDFNLPSN